MSRSAHPAGPRYADVMPEGGHASTPDDLDALDRKIWPTGVARATDGDGAVTFAGVDVRDLAREFGTPLYLIDEADWRDRARAWVDAFGDGREQGADVYYAGKAFLSVAIAKWAAEEGLHLDVCTSGELAEALGGE